METKTRWLSPELQVWLASLESVAPEEWEPLFAQMDPRRQSRCRRYLRLRDRRRCILADALARRALSQRGGVPPGDLRFDCQAGGKPFAADLALEFSLSHSGALVLCAVAPFPVGADIQEPRPISPGLLRRAARAGYDGASDADFLAWWVRQEAAGKLSGGGLSLGPLPGGLQFWSGEAEEAGRQYPYCVCAARASSISG